MEFSDIFHTIRLHLPWPPDEKKCLIGNDPELAEFEGKKKGAAEDQMIR